MYFQFLLYYYTVATILEQQQQCMQDSKSLVTRLYCLTWLIIYNRCELDFNGRKLLVRFSDHPAVLLAVYIFRMSLDNFGEFRALCRTCMQAQKTVCCIIHVCVCVHKHNSTHGIRATWFVACNAFSKTVQGSVQIDLIRPVKDNLQQSVCRLQICHWEASFERSMCVPAYVHWRPVWSTVRTLFWVCKRETRRKRKQE